VRALARRLKVRCAVRKLKLSAGASEEAAREGRLAALRAMAGMRKGGRSAGGGRFDVVVTAHHADDQAETVLMRMMRGTGIEGLAGIAARAEVGGLRLVRPLLSIRRSALREYLASIGQGWREDRTNASARYLRNRVRQTLMPLVQVLWPRGVEALGRLAQLAGETQGFVDEEVERWMGKGALRAEKGKVSISREVLRSAPAAVASEIVRRAIGVAAGQRGEPVAVDFERVRELLRLAAGRAGGKRVQMGKGMTLQVLREEIVIPRREGRRGEESKG
jgi:tRNA(Ile)-lysidine synthase